MNVVVIVMIVTALIGVVALIWAMLRVSKEDDL